MSHSSTSVTKSRIALLSGAALLAVSFGAAAAPALASGGAAPASVVAGSAVTSLPRLENGQSLKRDDSLISSNRAYDMYMQEDGNINLYRVKDNAIIWSANVKGQGGTKLTMQEDGNVVLTDDKGKAVWSTGTKTDRDGDKTHFELTDRGSLRVVRDGRVVWSTPNDGDGSEPAPTTTSTPGKPTSSSTSKPTTTSTKPSTTTPGKPTSTSKPPTTTPKPTTTSTPKPVPTDDMLPAGYGIRGRGALVSKGGRYAFALQGNGNLEVVDRHNGRILWQSKTAGRGADLLEVRADGNMVLTARGRQVWHTDTAGDHSDVRLVMQADGNAVLYHGSEAAWASNTENGQPAPGSGANIPSEEDSLAAAQFAEDHIGDAYRPGAMGPKQWGNPELVRAAWAKQNVKLDANVNAWFQQTVPVDYKDRRPGDILIFQELQTKAVRTAVVAEDINSLIEALPQNGVHKISIYKDLQSLKVYRPSI